MKAICTNALRASTDIGFFVVEDGEVVIFYVSFPTAVSML